MDRPTVGIDLGASYTKISYRAPLVREGNHKFAEGLSEVAIVDGAVTVPSIVIKTGNPRRPWLTGAEAASTNPGKGMEIFENWKSALYSSDFNAHKVKLVRVAGVFFQWLHERLADCGVVVDDDFRVRVTIPGLKRIKGRRDALVECMRLSGWPSDIEVVMEPTANLVGALTGGENCVTAFGKISYWRMFGARSADHGGDARGYLFGELRRHALSPRTRKSLTLSVVDLGSFTLDVAKLSVDLGVHQHVVIPVSDVVERSWELGVIGNLDKPCLGQLFSAHRERVDDWSFEVREEAKRALYAEGQYALPGRRVVLGKSPLDVELIESQVRIYCDDAWAKVAAYCKGSELVVLTGGGASIARVGEYFRKKLAKIGVRKVVGDWPDGQAQSQSGGDDCSFANWQETGARLGRLATCLGASSVALGFEPDEICAPRARS